MNIVEQLLAVDEAAVEKKATKTFKSKRLANIFGQSEPVDIIVEEVPYRRVSSIMASIVKGDGRIDYEKKTDAELRLILASVQNIDFKNDELKQKFHCATPKDLAEKILGAEIPDIAAVAGELSGWSDAKDEEEEIKNS